MEIHIRTQQSFQSPRYIVFEANINPQWAKRREAASSCLRMLLVSLIYWPTNKTWDKKAPAGTHGEESCIQTLWNLLHLGCIPPLVQ